jgi:CRP-like cAMP-binding protein
MRYMHSINVMPLLNCIAKIVNLDEPAVEMILDSCSDVLFPKGHLISSEGEVARYAYFIVSGKGRSYYTDETGRVITWSFHFNEVHSDLKNLFIVDYKSFLTQTPGAMTIEALTDIRAIRIGQRELGAKFGHLPVFGKCLQKLNEYFFIMAYERFFNFLTMTATDRYNKLLKNEPYLLQLFTDKYLASYIGVEPQSLSRIRKNLRSVPLIS